MSITDLAIKYRTSILVLTAILVFGGLFSYITIPKESEPSIEIPNIVVTTIYPGASPNDIESIITQRIEQEIQGINGIEEIRSNSNEGVSTIIVEFSPSVTMDDAFQKVRDKVDVAKSELPSDVEEPIVSEIDLSEFPIMTVNLAASYSLARLKELAEDLQDELEGISSVLEVDLIGGLDREVQVNVDLVALQGYNLTFNDVVNAIASENVNIPGGSVDADRLNYLVRVDGEVDDPEVIRDFVIKAEGGSPIYIRDIADVVYGFKDRTSYARLEVFRAENEDGEYIPLSDEQIQTLQVISLNVKKRSGENILETAAAVREVLDTFVLPSGTQTVITGDQSENVRTLVSDLENNIISGMIFVVLVLLFFLGLRTATLVGIAVPLSMFVSFIVFQTLGYTLNFIILFSLIVALGMLVDNAIVIVENIYRFREEGYDRWEAARLGTKEVGTAVIASTATTVAAFAPMLFWPGIIGEFMGYMPLTLIVTLTCSLFVALLINPVITGLFVKLDGEETGEPNRRARVLTLGIVAALALVVLLASWKTFVVLAVAIPLLWALHKWALKPAGDHFAGQTLPRVVRNYRSTLTWMLERDYSARAPLWRNTLALGAFTLGLVLTITGLSLSGVGPVVGPTGMGAAGVIFLLPGGILLLVGVVGVFIHAAESVFLGAKGSVIGGLIFGVVVAAILGLLFLAGNIQADVALILIALPLGIVVLGVLGMLFAPESRTLLLTDNRARLLTGALASLLGVFVLFGIAPTGVEFFPETDPTQVIVEAEAALGTNIEASNRFADDVQHRIDDLLRENPESKSNVKNIVTSVGVGGDALFGGGAASPENSRVTLNLVDYGEREEASTTTLARLRDGLTGIPGVTLEFTKDQNGPPTGAPVNIEITGQDFTVISRVAREITQRLRTASESGAIPGLVDVQNNLNSGRPELRVQVDRARAAQFGLNTRQIASTVRAAINGAEAGKYRTGDDEYDIYVRLAEDQRESLESLRNLTILYEGQQIPITAVADLEVGGGLGSVTRLDLERVATVTGDAAPGNNPTEVLGMVQAYLGDYEVPSGYRLSYTGESEEQAEAFGFLTRALLIGVALIFMIMVAQFNSISGPFIIMIAVGFSLVGVLLGLLLTRTPFGLMTFIGIISLAGIVVNNNIVLVDYITQLRDRGMDKQEAIIEGGATRLRPVILTALTTVIGLIPLTFGLNVDFIGLLTNLEPDFQFGSDNTQFWGPMGTAIISGLIFATFLTLVIVPVMYSTFDSLSTHLGAAFSRAPRVEAVVADGDGAFAPKAVPAGS